MEIKSHEFWSSSETNNFIYQQLKNLCEENGFVVSPRKTKHLIRIGEHHVQIVNPEVSYSRTLIHMRVAPAASFADYFYCYKTILPRKSNSKSEFINSYSELAIEDPSSLKSFYNIEQMKKTWAEVIGPQINEEIISYFNSFGFEQFVTLSQNREDHTLTYCANPASKDALLFIALGHNEIWKGNYQKGISFLEQALLGYKHKFERSSQSGRELLPAHLDNYNATIELLSALKNGDSSAGSQAVERLQELEKTALNKAWGVALSPEKKTIRLKKKELL